jgi:hypothetical protein
MKFTKLVAICAAVLLGCAFGGRAGESPSTVTALEFQTPKSGMTKQYEEGRKAKVAWHKQQKDHADAVCVASGSQAKQMGSYVVGRAGQHWADLDKPADH